MNSWLMARRLQNYFNANESLQTISVIPPRWAQNANSDPRICKQMGVYEECGKRRNASKRFSRCSYFVMQELSSQLVRRQSAIIAWESKNYFVHIRLAVKGARTSTKRKRAKWAKFIRASKAVLKRTSFRLND